MRERNRTAKIRYWSCPQDGDHIFDYDDWRLEFNYWTGKAKCLKDGRVLTLKVAEVRP